MQKATRNRSFLPKSISIIALGLSTVLTGYNAVAIDVVTDPVGFYKVTATNGSDTVTSVPFTRVPEFQGLVASVSGNTLSISNNPGWTPTTQWATPNGNGFYPYFVQLSSGAKEGAFYTITNNDATSLSVILVPEDLSSIAAGDKVKIIPFWTLNTIFPGGSGIVPSTSTAAPGRHTTVFFPDLTSAGVNLANSQGFYFFTNWRRSLPVTVATSNFNDQVVLPDQYIVIRNITNVTDVSTCVAPGSVVLYKTRTPLYASPPPANGQDNAVAIYRPAVQTLIDSGLSNAIVASASTAAPARRDQVLVFDNAQQAQNKAASQIFYFSTFWRRSLPSTPSSVDWGTSNIFNPGTGFVIRRATNGIASPSANMWLNPPNY